MNYIPLSIWYKYPSQIIVIHPDSLVRRVNLKVLATIMTEIPIVASAQDGNMRKATVRTLGVGHLFQGFLPGEKIIGRIKFCAGLTIGSVLWRVNPDHPAEEFDHLICAVRAIDLIVSRYQKQEAIRFCPRRVLKLIAKIISTKDGPARML